jgi:hypothetical protein
MDKVHNLNDSECYTPSSMRPEGVPSNPAHPKVSDRVVITASRAPYSKAKNMTAITPKI